MPAESSIINLPGWDVTRIDQSEHDCRVEARYTVEPRTCARCGAALIGHGSRPQEIRDRPHEGKPVRIVLLRLRYRCPGCGTTVLQPIPDLIDGGMLTRRLVDWLVDQCQTRTQVTVAEEAGVDPSTIRHYQRLRGYRVGQGRRKSTPGACGDADPE